MDICAIFEEIPSRRSLVVHLPEQDGESWKHNAILEMTVVNGHGFLFFFYALLSHDNDLLSRYLDITKVVFLW